MTKSLQTHIRNVLKKVNMLTKVNKCKNKPTMKSCALDLISSFIAMDVSNQLKQVFEFFDIDGDGKISQVELTNVLLTFGQEKSKATIEAQGILKEVDFNGDGFIDLDEFMTIMDGSKPVFASSKEDNGDDDLRNAFLVFDSDKNGLISAKELQRVLMSLGCSNSKIGQCRKMIKGVDKDGDGFVDFEEFKSMMSIGIH
ncbi:putative EF-hand domain pair protein CML [Helianthus annuus]|uniref:EF-hand domain pair protein CML n=1 Tax=Helianthus annuus TaxID=4232 RepID=A0A251RUE4_HELAN|nr:probable calcium-binding protein CML23 [Helianthus annuus]KAF5756822.1 putative EF-hand domain pair protein CML [Helianthus annuus]KAJ0435098.1 putative EF-hand domain pair protein CML [Helianthus annuus]KAJ0448694.1 putative EF-hand domain-containing protein [Helianthus annuus]KAJ0633575.1 putative EF-hand domain-containing protein [Helianthus annuus]KAJ0637393.1 putative EF-hand domain-containing protein [Helianthus annuus]